MTELAKSYREREKIWKEKKKHSQKKPRQKNNIQKERKRWIILERKMKCIQRERKKPNDKQYLQRKKNRDIVKNCALQVDPLGGVRRLRGQQYFLQSFSIVEKVPNFKTVTN